MVGGRRGAGVVGAAIVLWSCVGCAAADPVPVSSYALYDVVLSEIANSSNADPLLVRRDTWSLQFDSSTARFLAREIPDFPPDLVEAARIANASPYTLVDSLTGGDRYLLLDEDLADADFVELRALYGDTIATVTLSQVGFSRDGTEALMYYTFTCPSFNCVTGYYLYLRRENGAWVVSDAVIGFLA